MSLLLFAEDRRPATDDRNAATLLPMAFCPACGTSVPPTGRFCSSCGAALAPSSQTPPDADATIDYSATRSIAPSASPAPRSASKPSNPSGTVLLSEGRFLPGRLIAGRYRIIALLGRGGMGEVYRADDLTLGQPVALKFLPEKAAANEELLERFRNEVRVARKVSHPNVCRVYDVGDVDGHTFFTMEYVDGEDLASLLRRIGRLPSDKAVEIARQLCAGLAAAHAKGVLHRDLKPANIMLDGRGQVVVTDFGLASLADQIAGADVRSGTPAYMSPEQLEGREVTTKSDIYALGLVLYEIFTGKRAFSAESLPDLTRDRADHTPSRPSSLVKDLDPAVERVILRCLEPDPASRPSAVLSVAAALPGADPLAAALAAGETPSPQMVAAAGETTGLAPRYAILCLAVAIVGLALVGYLNIRGNIVERSHLELSPEVLDQKAREIMQKLGYSAHSLDRASFFDSDPDFLTYVRDTDRPRPDWNQVLASRPTYYTYWYRQSPRYLVAGDFNDVLLTPDVVTSDDPAPTVSGMVTVRTDPQGHLLYLLAVPQQKEDPPQKKDAGAAPPATDWSAPFAAAGLDISQFHPAPPEWASVAASDERAAWTGVWPGSGRPLRVEASAWRGKPNYFELIGPWTKPSRMPQPQPATKLRLVQIVLLVIFLSMLVGCAWLARRSYFRGSADRDGAARLALVVFVLDLFLWLCRAHIVFSTDMVLPLVIALSTSLFLAAVVYVMYLALEPYVRRNWPQGIISWSRLLQGQFRDPVVGRDALFGVLLGLSWVLIYSVKNILEVRRGGPPQLYSEGFLMGSRAALASWLVHIPLSIQSTLIFFFLILVFRLLLRKDWLAALAFIALGTVVRLPNADFPAIEAGAQILIYGIAAVVVLRFGLVALAVGIFCADVLLNAPLTADLSAWFAPNGLFVVTTVAALAAWSFYITTRAHANPAGSAG
ncbi:MAG TPA: serine/threonine-protein kinase [Terriglobales bacterium]